MNLLFDTVIAGSGLAGACAAYQLSMRERVLVLDQAEPGAGASGVSVGLVSPLMARRARPVWCMPEAMSALDRLLDASGAGFLFQRGGVLKPAHSVEQALEFQDAAAKWPEHGTWHNVASSNVRWPNVSANFGLLEVTTGGSIEMPALCRHLLDAAVKQGATLRTGARVSGWTEVGEEVRIRVESESQDEIRAGRLVLAIGAGYLDFQELRSLKLHPIKGQWIRLISESGAGESAERDADQDAERDADSSPEFAVDPNTFTPVSSRRYVAGGDGVFVVGSTYEHDYTHIRPTSAAAIELHHEAAQLVPRLKGARLTDVAAAVRVTVPGIRLPMVGPLPGRRRVWIFTGLGSKGLLMAPMLAEQLPEFFTQPQDIPKQIRVS